jgi:hypothetical protein
MAIELSTAPNPLARTDWSLRAGPLRAIRLSQDKAVPVTTTTYNGLTAEVRGASLAIRALR